MTTSVFKPPEPRCARCFTLAEDMPYLDTYWPESVRRNVTTDEDRRRMRAEYVRNGDGTYNKATGSFWCDECYVAIGCPKGVAP